MTGCWSVCPSTSKLIVSMCATFFPSYTYMNCVPRRKACHPGLGDHRAVSRRRNDQRRKSSLACPIRSRRRLRNAQEGQRFVFGPDVLRQCLEGCVDHVAGHYLPHCRRNSGTCIVVGIEELCIGKEVCSKKESSDTVSN